MEQHEPVSSKDSLEQQYSSPDPRPERDDPWVKAYMESVNTQLRPRSAESAARRLIRQHWPAFAAGLLLVSGLLFTVYAYVRGIDTPAGKEDAVVLEGFMEEPEPDYTESLQPTPVDTPTAPESKAVKEVARPPSTTQEESAPPRTAPREHLQQRPARTRPPATDAPQAGQVAARGTTPVGGGASAGLPQTRPRSAPQRTLTPEQKRLMAQESQARAVPRTQPRPQTPVRTLPPRTSPSGVTPPRYAPY